MKKKGKSERSMNHGTSENEGKPWGQGSYANMPQEEVMREYPVKGYGLEGKIDDTMVRIDGDSKDSNEMVKRQKHRSMY